MSETSQWRMKSRNVIAGVPARLPAYATEKQKRDELKKAYPFGERKYHPYKLWLDEVRKALGSKPPTQRFDVEVFLNHRKRPWWISVRCHMCGTQDGRGCMVCGQTGERLGKLLESADFHRWLAVLKDDPTASLVFGDWLEEQGWPELADDARRTVQVKCPTCKGRGEYSVKVVDIFPGIGRVVDTKKASCHVCGKTGRVFRVEADQ